MYDVFKDFAGPVATIFVAAVAGFITWQYNRRQLVIAQDKLKFDLFERRYRVYQATKELIEHLTTDKFKMPNTEVMNEIAKLRTEIREAQFFFGKDLCARLDEILEMNTSIFTNFQMAESSKTTAEIRHEFQKKAAILNEV